MTDLRATVIGIYQAFGRGEVPFILDQLAPDVRWEDWPADAPNFAQQAGVPYMEARRGKEGALEFFQLLSTYKFPTFDVRNVLVGGNQVAGLVVIEINFPNGNTVREEEMHLFEFNADGKVTRFRHYIDTAKAIAAMK